MKFIAIKIFRFIFHKPYFITFCFLTFFILGCKKKTSEQIVKVTYEVVMINGVKTTIDYNSDYYIETGKRKENGERKGACPLLFRFGHDI